MSKVNLTCIECPIGCAIEVEREGNETRVSGNGCPRGKLYAENEVVCPKRVLTSAVRMTNGEMLPVKTDAPIPKAELFSAMEKLKSLHPAAPVKIGDILLKNISDGVNLIATGNAE